MSPAIQSQPVMRNEASAQLISSSIEASCATGEFCCEKNGSKFCGKCPITDPFLGVCLVGHETTCREYGATPTAGC